MVGVCPNIYQLEILVKLKIQEVAQKKISRTPDNDELGFLFEYDLQYPSSVHEKHEIFSIFAR